jgi:hypothetical protein
MKRTSLIIMTAFALVGLLVLPATAQTVVEESDLADGAPTLTCNGRVIDVTGGTSTFKLWEYGQEGFVGVFRGIGTAEDAEGNVYRLRVNGWFSGTDARGSGGYNVVLVGEHHEVYTWMPRLQWQGDDTTVVQRGTCTTPEAFFED